jgi:hypothetical protein
MAKHRMTVEQHYTEGRHHPYGRNTDDDAERSIRRSPSMESASAKAAFNKNTNQDPEDKYDAGYLNDASGWVRGAKGEPTGFNETATNYPGGNFDRGNSWRSPTKSIHSELSDTQPLRKPVGET